MGLFYRCALGCLQKPTKTWTLLYPGSEREIKKPSPFASGSATPLQRVGQAVDYGLWNVGPLLLHGCAELLESNPESQPCSLVQSACRPCKNWSQTILKVMVEVLAGCTYSCSMVVRQVGCPAKWSEVSLETTCKKEMKVQSMASSSGDIPADSTPTAAMSVALCRLIKLHILE